MQIYVLSLQQLTWSLSFIWLMRMGEWLLTWFHPINFSHNMIHEKHFWNTNILLCVRVCVPFSPPPPCPFPLAAVVCLLLALQVQIVPTILTKSIQFSHVHVLNFCLKLETTRAPGVNRRFSPSILVAHP